MFHCVLHGGEASACPKFRTSVALLHINCMFCDIFECFQEATEKHNLANKSVILSQLNQNIYIWLCRVVISSSSNIYSVALYSSREPTSYPLNCSTSCRPRQIIKFKLSMYNFCTKDLRHSITEL